MTSTIANSLAVIIPVYNEERTVVELLTKVLGQPCVAQVIVVDDASMDQTASLLQSFCKTPKVVVLRHAKNTGKGAAIVTGLKAVTSPLVIIQDADLEYSPEDYERLLRAFDNGRTDVVYGSRFLESDLNKHIGGWQRWCNTMITFAGNCITGYKLTDEATCFKAFPTQLLRALELQERGFGFCPEVTSKLAVIGAKITEVPITFQPRTRLAGKKLRMHHGVEALICLLKYRLNAGLRNRRLPLRSSGQQNIPIAMDCHEERL